MRQTPLLLGTLLLAACSETATEPQAGSTTPKPLASVQVTPGTHTLNAIGATQQFQAIARDADGTTISGKLFTWASSSPAVATVNSSGLATAVTDGSSTITATTDGVSENAALTVAQAVASVEVTSPEDTLTALGATTSLTATPKDANGNPVAGKTATWSSSSAATATVDTDGTVTTVANGEVTITATVDGIDGSVALVVNQAAPTLLPPDAEPVEFELVSQLTRPVGGPNEPARLVIRDQAEWDEYWNGLPTVVMPRPAPPAFDFSRDMVLIAAMGQRGSGGHFISIEGVYESGGELYVDVLEVSPGLGCITTQVMTAPMAGVRLPTRDAQVHFLERTESRPCS